MSLVERASDFLGDSEVPETDLAPETAYDLLRSPRRRVVIHTLAAASEPLAYSDLVDAVAASETDTAPAALDAADRKRVYVSIHQSHVPRLVDAEVVTVREAGDRRVIEPGSNLAALADLDHLVTESLEPQA